MATSMTSVTSLLKEMYEGPLRDQLNNDVVTLRRIEKTSEGTKSDAGGKYVVFPIKTTRNQGIGARAEMEALPSAGQQGRAAARVGMRHQYGSVQFSGQVFELAKSDPQSFVSIIDDELSSIKDDLALDLNRQVYGDGSGAVHFISGAGTVNTATVTHTVWGQIGMVIDIYDSTGVTQKASSRNVTALTATSVTFDGAAVAVVVGDIIVRKGNVGNATTQREWTGLGKIVQSSGGLYNVTDPVWTSTVDSNAGTLRALSEGLITTTVDAVRARGGKTTALFTTLGVRRAYANLLQTQRRFNNTQEFTGGFSGLAYTTDSGDIPMVTDVYAPPNTMYGLNEKELKWYRSHDFTFMNRDGSMFERVTGFDAYNATLFQYSELGCHRRNSQFVIKDITEN